MRRAKAVEEWRSGRWSARFRSVTLTKSGCANTRQVEPTPDFCCENDAFLIRNGCQARGAGRSWLSIAHHLGYSDQMYMVRDIKSLAGKAPSEVFHQMGDYQRWSLSSPATAYHFPETDSGFLADSSEAAKEPRSGASRQAPAVKTFLFVPPGPGTYVDQSPAQD